MTEPKYKGTRAYNGLVEIKNVIKNKLSELKKSKEEVK